MAARTAISGQPPLEKDGDEDSRGGVAAPVYALPGAEENQDVVSLKGGQPHLLVVDDDPTLLRSVSRMLTQRGYAVTTASNGQFAVDLVHRHQFDAILSDIAMPQMDGIELLRNVRQHDLLVQVILITGAPAIDTAVQALEYGALHYLTKPVSNDELASVVERAVGLYRLARVKQQAMDLMGTGGAMATDRAGLEASLARCLDSLWIAYQPIVDVSARTVTGFEALLRSQEPSLPHPGAVLDAAERLDALPRLGRTIRTKIGEDATRVPPGALLFVNLHVQDLLDPELYSPEAPLSKIADRVVLEITERSSLDVVRDAKQRIATLREMGFRIAVDDLGAGYAGLTSFALLEPEFVKLDMTLVRDIGSNPTRQKVIRSMTSLAHEMRMLVVAEGVETPEEASVLLGLDCDLLQGFLLSKPSRPFPEPTWPNI